MFTFLIINSITHTLSLNSVSTKYTRIQGFFNQKKKTTFVRLISINVNTNTIDHIILLIFQYQGIKKGTYFLRSFFFKNILTFTIQKINKNLWKTSFFDIFIEWLREQRKRLPKIKRQTSN